MSSKTWVSRRNVLRGLGVGLALPWLESLSAPPAARAQGASPTKRYMIVYFPCGVSRPYWDPKGEGAGSAWSLSALLEPLAPYKQYLQVLTNVGQEALYNKGLNPNPSHSLYCAPSFSCTVPDTTLPIIGGPSVDQVIASNIGGATPFKSLQFGCATMVSSTDSRHPSMSRSISWAASDQPLYKEVNPQAMFDSLVTQLAPGGGSPKNQALAQMRKDRGLSLLDYVLKDATSLQTKLSVSDRRRLDQFLTSVRDVEGRVKSQGTSMPGSTKMYTRPTMSASPSQRRGTDASDPAGYNRGVHAELMNDLISMALETDLTRVVTHMLDDARSDYHYQFLKQRTFANGTSVEVDAALDTVQTGGELGYHGLSHNNPQGFATVNYWFVQKFASLLGRLTMPTQADGKNVLDDTIILFMSGMQGSSHQLTQLPVLLASGGAVLKKDHRTTFAGQAPLTNLHLTLMQAGFGIDVQKFGYSSGTLPAILA
jgi:Protein of unknown function (DUF1552)